MAIPADKIWLPESVWHKAERAVDKAVHGYDQRLRFGRNEDTGQWCIFMLNRNDAPLAILGFNDIPHPDDALRRLLTSDARRRGKEILAEINKHNDDIKQGFEDKASEASGEAAEAFEWAFRQQGKHPVPRIFVPGRG